LKYLSTALLWGRFLALLANIRLGWKGLPGTNTLGTFLNYGRKKSHNIGTWLALAKRIGEGQSAGSAEQRKRLGEMTSGQSPVKNYMDGFLNRANLRSRSYLLRKGSKNV
jgi:hypothetical protein